MTNQSMTIPTLPQPTDSTAPTFAVDIAFPCYNADKWIDRFLGSLLKQDDPRWRLVARNDGSNDDTAPILRRWRDRLGPRFLLLDGDGPSPNLGITGNFNAILEACTAPWIVTADPDDDWLPNRLDVTLSALQRAEERLGADTPVAVCTDADVVDADDNVLADSYWRWSRTSPPSRYSLRRMSMDSVALGSTMAFNRALLRAALPIRAGAAYQDWWLALAAVAFGEFIALPDVTIHYRRHGANATKDPYTESIAGMTRRLIGAPKSARERVNYLLRQAGRQAGAFVQAYGERIDSSDGAALRALSQLETMTPLARRASLVRHGLWFNSPIKNIGLLALV